MTVVVETIKVGFTAVESMFSFDVGIHRSFTDFTPEASYEPLLPAPNMIHIVSLLRLQSSLLPSIPINVFSRLPIRLVSSAYLVSPYVSPSHLSYELE